MQKSKESEAGPAKKIPQLLRAHIKDMREMALLLLEEDLKFRKAFKRTQVPGIDPVK